MLEREVLVRCIKHIFGKYIRDCESDELITATIAHLFNLILAPREFIKRLDDGSVFCKVETLKQKADLSLLDDKRKLEGPTAAAEAMAMIFNHINKSDVISQPKLFVDEAIFAQTKSVLQTRATPIGVELVTGDFKNAALDKPSQRHVLSVIFSN
mgnify:CR=1 FL=1